MRCGSGMRSRVLASPEPLSGGTLYPQKSNNNTPFQFDLLKLGRPIFSGNRGPKGGSLDAHPASSSALHAARQRMTSHLQVPDVALSDLFTGFGDCAVLQNTSCVSLEVRARVV